MDNLDQTNSQNSQIYIMVLRVLIAPHIKFELIWRSFAILTKIGIKTCCNISNSYQKGILDKINSKNSQI